MRMKNDEVEEALEQLEKMEDIKEENDRLNSTLNKLKGKQGEKEANIEVDNNGHNKIIKLKTNYF